MENLFIPRRLEERKENFEKIKQSIVEKFDLIKHKLKASIQKDEIEYKQTISRFINGEYIKVPFGVVSYYFVKLTGKKPLSEEDVNFLADWLWILKEIPKGNIMEIDNFTFITLCGCYFSYTYEDGYIIDIQLTCDYYTKNY